MSDKKATKTTPKFPGRKEAVPLKPDDLSVEQRAVFDKVMKFCTQTAKAVESRDPNPERRGNGPSKWLESERINNNVLLSGQRGSGKTTVLLTLLKKLREDAKHTFIVLPTVDAPELSNRKLPLFGLTAPFRELYSELNEHEHRLSRSTKSELENRFDEFLEAATARDTYDELVEKEDYSLQDSALELASLDDLRVEVAERFKAFVDVLGQVYIEVRKPAGPKHPIFVLPVDDIDLNVHQTKALLELLRLCSQPDIIPIVLGDELQLRSSIFEMIVDEHQNNGDWVLQARQTSERMNDELWATSSRVLKKLIPETQRSRIADSVTFPNEDLALRWSPNLFWNTQWRGSQQDLSNAQEYASWLAERMSPIFKMDFLPGNMRDRVELLHYAESRDLRNSGVLLVDREFARKAWEAWFEIKRYPGKGALSYEVAELQIGSVANVSNNTVVRDAVYEGIVEKMRVLVRYPEPIMVGQSKIVETRNREFVAAVANWDAVRFGTKPATDTDTPFAQYTETSSLATLDFDGSSDGGRRPESVQLSLPIPTLHTMSELYLLGQELSLVGTSPQTSLFKAVGRTALTLLAVDLLRKVMPTSRHFEVIREARELLRKGPEHTELESLVMLLRNAIERDAGSKRVKDWVTTQMPLYGSPILAKNHEEAGSILKLLQPDPANVSQTWSDWLKSSSLRGSSATVIVAKDNGPASFEWLEYPHPFWDLVGRPASLSRRIDELRDLWGADFAQRPNGLFRELTANVWRRSLIARLPRAEFELLGSVLRGSAGRPVNEGLISDILRIDDVAKTIQGRVSASDAVEEQLVDEKLIRIAKSPNELSVGLVGLRTWNNGENKLGLLFEAVQSVLRRPPANRRWPGVGLRRVELFSLSFFNIEWVSLEYAMEQWSKFFEYAEQRELHAQRTDGFGSLGADEVVVAAMWLSARMRVESYADERPVNAISSILGEPREAGVFDRLYSLQMVSEVIDKRPDERPDRWLEMGPFLACELGLSRAVVRWMAIALSDVSKPSWGDSSAYIRTHMSRIVGRVSESALKLGIVSDSKEDIESRIERCLEPLPELSP